MKRNKFIVILILCIWFVISFVTNILGPIMPAIIENYHLSLTLAAFLPFSFFLAYGLMSVPAGLLIERFGEKPALLLSFFTAFLGAAAFAVYPVYAMALLSLFVIGMGMAMLQVIINPLMRVAGGEEHFAFYSVLSQLVFGSASFVSPYVFIWLTDGFKDHGGGDNFMVALLRKVVPENIPWNGLYWIFAAIFIVLMIVIYVIRLPKVQLVENEKAGAFHSYVYLLKKRQTIIYFLGIMCYVGSEQGLANFMSQFLSQYHGADPAKLGAHTIALFWGWMSLGCLAGLVILKLIDSTIALRIFSFLAIIAVATALFGSAQMAIWAFPAAGFFISLHFSIVFSLALNSEEHHHGSYSGILCSGIFGGALVPLIIGWLGDLSSLRTAMTFIFIPLLFILGISFWAKPLIRNKTIFGS